LGHFEDTDLTKSWMTIASNSDFVKFSIEKGLSVWMSIIVVVKKEIKYCFEGVDPGVSHWHED